jgi:NOL1/NOP2/fmu family ribosome biogenesis protein
MKLKVLNSRERKNFFKIINTQFDADYSTDDIILSNKEKYYLLSRKWDEVPDEVLYYYQAGMYFASDMKDGIRLTIEGSQIVGKTAKKNIMDLDEKQIKEWVRAYDLHDLKGDDGFYLIRHNGDFYASGKLKEGKMFNYVPKGRRLVNIHD